MGYYTQFRLEIKFLSGVTENEREGFTDFIRKELNNLAFGDVSDVLEDGSESYTWYDHEDDMRKISVKYPMAIFVLSGEGEEGGDLWRKYFLAGRMHGGKAKIVYEEFNPKELTKDEASYRIWARQNHVEADDD